MKIRQPSFSQGPSPKKTLAAMGACLLSHLVCPFLLFAAEQLGGATGKGTLTGGQDTLSLTTTIFKTLGSLVLVVGIMLLLLLWLKKTGLVRAVSRPDGLITVLDSQMLAPKKQVSVLEVAGAYLVVGLTEQQITLLATLDPNDRLKEAAQSRKTSSPLPASLASVITKHPRAYPA